MDDKANPNRNDEEESTGKEAKREIEMKVIDKDKKTYKTLEIIQDDAGASGSGIMPLPGAVTRSPRLNFYKIGHSRSEHSIGQIITNQDVANALKLTSLSFGTTNTQVKNLNLKDLKIPIVNTSDGAAKVDSATILDLKKFMASCFKFNKETPGIVLSEIPANTQTGITNEPVQGMPDVSFMTSNAQTDNIEVATLPNEVIITNPNTMELKVAKFVSEGNKVNKKTSGSLSPVKSDLGGLAQRDSLSSIGSNVCRICMTRGKERLISPCNCKGSLANVHLSCLERWLNQVGRNHCELCGFSYPAIRTPRYTVLQAVRLWIGNPRNRSHLQSDCLIFWLLSTVTAGLLAVCIVGTQYFVIEGNKFGKLEAPRKQEGISHRITETAMDFFMAIVLCGYTVTVYLLWKDHYVMWNRWRRANVNVRLLLSPDSNPVPFVPRSRYNVV